MKNLCVFLTICSMIGFGGTYIYRLRKNQVELALATWIIFSIGTSLSLITYAIAQDRDFISGIMNTADVAVCASISYAIFRFGNKEVRFQPFEKWYLAGVTAIVIYGLWSGNAWNSNLFLQALISLGFAPTVHKLIKEKKNSESFLAWSFNVLAGLFALYPSITGGKILATVYALRSIVLVVGITALMAYYQFWRPRRTNQSS